MKDIKINKKYNQTKDKKKICPKCNKLVFNATLTCQLKNKNGNICGHKFISRKQKIFIEVINNIILTIENNSHNNDIKIINNLSKMKNMRCLSPYRCKKTQFISFESLQDMKKIKPINLAKIFNEY